MVNCKKTGQFEELLPRWQPAAYLMGLHAGLGLKNVKWTFVARLQKDRL